MLWCYYLGQVWPFEVLLSGPSLFFIKHCLSKNTINIGVSVKLLTPSLPSAPLPSSNYKAKTTERPSLGSRKEELQSKGPALRRQ